MVHSSSYLPKGIYLGMATKPSIWEQTRETFLEKIQRTLSYHSIVSSNPSHIFETKLDNLYVTYIALIDQRNFLSTRFLHAGDIVFPIQCIHVLNFVLQVRSNLRSVKQLGNGDLTVSGVILSSCPVKGGDPSPQLHSTCFIGIDKTWIKVEHNHRAWKPSRLKTRDSLTSAFVGRTELFE